MGRCTVVFLFLNNAYPFASFVECLVCSAIILANDFENTVFLFDSKMSYKAHIICEFIHRTYQFCCLLVTSRYGGETVCQGWDG